MPTDDPLAELREALATGVAAAADLFALDAVPAAMEAALNRFGRATTSADAVRRQALRHAARLRDVQELFGDGPCVAARARRGGRPGRGVWFLRQFERLGEEGA